MTTRKQFEATAQLIRGTHTDTDNENEVVKNLAERFAAMYARENPRFNHAKFMQACGF